MLTCANELERAPSAIGPIKGQHAALARIVVQQASQLRVRGGNGSGEPVRPVA